MPVKTPTHVRCFRRQTRALPATRSGETDSTRRHCGVPHEQTPRRFLRASLTYKHTSVFPASLSIRQAPAPPMPSSLTFLTRKKSRTLLFGPFRKVQDFAVKMNPTLPLDRQLACSESELATRRGPNPGSPAFHSLFTMPKSEDTPALGLGFPASSPRL